ncbi:class III extradiol dioxygenase subunit B-like domain-containing protein [Kribbella sp. NPDC051770]|uniref:class III extradiol dioxygenase subunit B-like domain-containing protein n=1 Tax=Kribbella sp. NPDC051770 TaxID=3155413 RepID=UPI00344A7384
MPVISAAVCPHPPLLVPEIATGAAADLDDLRAACLTALTPLAAADRLVVVGSGAPARYAADAAGSLTPYGVPFQVGTGTPTLPLSLTIGAWLLNQSKAADVPRSYYAVAPDETPANCLALGKQLADSSDRVALLIMGDGSARRSEHSPVHLHPRAELFDSTVAAALQLADTATLAALDPDLATELHAAGRAPWQVLAATSGLTGNLLYHAAPYGVGYLVASWT